MTRRGLLEDTLAHNWTHMSHLGKAWRVGMRQVTVPLPDPAAACDRPEFTGSAGFGCQVVVFLRGLKGGDGFPGFPTALVRKAGILK